MAVTQHDIAKKLKISQASVSHVLNGRENLLRPETVKRIREALEEAHYQPHLAASTLRKGRSGFVGLILPNLRHPMYVEISRLLHQLAWEAGYRVVMFNAEDDADSEKSFIREAVSFRAEGLIILGFFSPPRKGIEHLQKIIDEGTPVVSIDSHKELSCPSVTVDRMAAMETVMGHLFGLGHRNVAFAAYGREHLPGLQRWQGIKSAYQKAGLELPSDDDFYPPFVGVGHRALAAGVEATEMILARRALQEDKKYTAIVAMNDQVALGATRCLADHGLSVPQDMSVAGFDDMDMCAYCAPRLTTVNQSKQQLAQLGFEILREQIDHKSQPESRVLPAHLVVRESTSRAPGTAGAGGIIETSNSKEQVARQSKVYR